MLKTADAESRSTTPVVQHFARTRVLYSLAVFIVIGLAIFNLTRFPVPWYDEGSHLHVPKTLVKYGVYADYSSEGFRYYGPSIGIGPTVMLPVAAVFKVFGMGLLQARLVMVMYLFVAILVFFLLARTLGGGRMAWFAATILVGSQGINLLETGRQILGEVPALAFMVGGWLLWLRAESNPTLRSLIISGAVLGLSAVTKSQTALILIPALFVAWLANLVFYRRLPQRYFLIPLGMTVGFFGVWQLIALAFLGPGTLSENLALLRQFSSGAAFVFEPDLITRSVKLLLGPDVFAGMLVPITLYGLAISLRRTSEGQRWGNLMIFVIGGLAWYVFASISWLRYAFAPLSLAALFAAKLIDDVLGRIDLRPHAWWARLQRGDLRAAIVPAAIALFVMMSLAPLALTARHIVFPPESSAQQIVDYLNANVPRDALIETWEPELGFLTDHNYHFPPQVLLDTAVRHVWLDGPAPADQYNLDAHSPDLVITGAFSEYAELYRPDQLAVNYELIDSFGAYHVYARVGSDIPNPSSP